MSPDQKATLQQIADRLYGEIATMHEISRTLGDSKEMHELREARLSLRAAAAKIDEVLYDAHTVELETRDYTPHERKTCQACGYGCCAMTSDVA